MLEYITKTGTTTLEFNPEDSTFSIKKDEQLLATFEFVSVYDLLWESAKAYELHKSLQGAVKRRAIQLLK